MVLACGLERNRMKIDFEKHLNKGSLLDHMVIHGLVECDAVSRVADDPAYKSDQQLEIVLTVNGIEIDVEGFCEHWQSQVERMIDEAAAKLLDSKIGDQLDEIEAMVDCAKVELGKRLGIEIKQPWE